MVNGTQTVCTVLYKVWELPSGPDPLYSSKWHKPSKTCSSMVHNFLDILVVEWAVCSIDVWIAF